MSSKRKEGFIELYKEKKRDKCSQEQLVEIIQYTLVPNKCMHSGKSFLATNRSLPLLANTLKPNGGRWLRHGNPYFCMNNS